eukprot:gnl/MRDRNA2_/MRDRNA2_143377_c0_seq1.p1 gnl/MRDRNA2_/MRDRNA2_143377_c0~~gnl/MRDRNA2_/MRDRNA2_143377_c0_seq1.p1  ORF type:complete len:282 (-),score=65.22 gnl/MRDRNA2_/MRDRNA2_143377_c0_seq1:74-919(-)
MLSKYMKFTNAEPMAASAILQLKDDFKGENADARDEDLRKKDFEQRIKDAQKQCREHPSDGEKMLRLAEAYGVLDPTDKQCLDTCDKLLILGVKSLDLQRQGDFWQLRGRSLFMHDKYDESLLSFLRAKDCYREKGNKALRKLNNTALLRVYASLGRSKMAAERLEIALTLCEKNDETCLLYMHAKNALEQTGTERDVEVLDDIWYVQLDMNPELRKTHDQLHEMTKNLSRQCSSEGKPKSLSFTEIIKEMLQDETTYVILMASLFCAVVALALGLKLAMR